MDLHQILITHNRAWTKRELVFFLIVFTVAALLAGRWVRKGRIRKGQAVSGLLALIFLAVVYASTVFTRTSGIRRIGWSFSGHGRKSGISERTEDWGVCHIIF